MAPKPKPKPIQPSWLTNYVSHLPGFQTRPDATRARATGRLPYVPTIGAQKSGASPAPRGHAEDLNPVTRVTPGDVLDNVLPVRPAFHLGQAAASAVDRGDAGGALGALAMAAPLGIPEGKVAGLAEKLGLKTASKSLDALATPTHASVESALAEQEARKRAKALGFDPEEAAQLSRQIDAPAAPAGPKRFADFTPEDLEAYGQQHGVPGLGTKGGTHLVTLADGRVVNIPGGLEGRFSYHDLLELKAQGINPRHMDPEMHIAIQKKLERTMAPGAHDDDANLFRALTFGITSPNSPLTPNEITVARAMPRHMDDIRELAKFAPSENTKAARVAADAAVAEHLGIQARGKGGLGTRGSADLSRLADMAKMFSENPQWFRKSAEEGWDVYAQRLASQVPGLGVKTGGLGTMFTDLPNAGISAMDRHMGDIFWQHLASSPQEQAKVEKALISDWNKTAKKEGKQRVTSIDELRGQPGGEGIFKDRVMQLLTNHKSPKLDLAKGGVNPALPEWAKSVDWINRPEKVVVMGDNYKRALDVNAEHAAQSGLSLGSSQWNLWDRIRGRLEPHEMMYPGLNKLPRMPLEDVLAARDAHAAAGYFGNQKSAEAAIGATKPVKKPMNLAFWSLLGGAGLGGGLLGDDEPPRR